MVVLVRKGGIDRTYRCNSKFDAIELFDALTRGMGDARIELWEGMTLVTAYDASLRA
jgi:hypothetical protein